MEPIELFGITWLPHTWPLLIMVSLVAIGVVGGAVVELVQDRKNK